MPLEVCLESLQIDVDFPILLDSRMDHWLVLALASGDRYSGKPSVGR